VEAGGEGVVVGEGTGFKSTEMGVAAEAEGKVAAEEEVEVEVEKEDNLGKVKGLDSRLFVILTGNLNSTLLHETHMRASILNTVGSVFQAMRTLSGGLATWLNLRAEEFWF
jgi:hypothetical protein